mmetsp:Transcript_36757/g.80603  ORF Transcript_36757/g.80603 Transcript_36757/m.80603 type:complete len:303 (-) Transcript_36757:81-989(-)
MANICKLTQAQAIALRDEGFVVIDGFLPPEYARELRDEAFDFAHSGKMPEHRFQFGASQLLKPHIFEADLHDPAMREVLPSLAENFFDDSLVDDLSNWLPELQLMRGPSAKALKLQYNSGSGGCFPLHYDNVGRPSKRAVSCLVYLNAQWQKGDGGELQLVPFLRPEVTVEPLMGRAVLFRSDRILHRVLPAAAERFCFTIWFDSKAINSDVDCNLTSRHITLEEDDDIKAFCTSPVQRAVSRAVYADEYEESLSQCLREAEGCAEVLEEHRQHVAKQLSHPQLGPFIARLRLLRQKATAAE